MLPVIDALDLSREEIVYTDSITTANCTYVGKFAAGLTPVNARTAVANCQIYRIITVGNVEQMQKPVEASGTYFSDANYQVWDSRAGYTYG